MPKYADITPFYEWLDWLEKESNSRYPEYNTMMFYEIRDKLDDLPEIIRCRDCRYYDNSEGICWCKLNSKFYPGGFDWHCFPENGFCSYGEGVKDND